MTEVPKMFRLSLQVSNMDKAAAFYSKLLGTKGRRIHGSRHYFDCGPVILAIVDESMGRAKPKPIPDYAYFSVKDIKKMHARAKKLKCLSKEDVHGEPAGEIVVRPWRERSFYARDPYGNNLCFVEDGTLFTGLR